MKINILLAATLLALSTWAADTNSLPDPAETKYTAAIESRTADILKILALGDAEKSGRVHDVIVAQYRALRAWHEENDVKLKAAAKDTNAAMLIRVSLKTLHDAFLTMLSENLTQEQVEAVKDKMTYGKVQFTFGGYSSQYPHLTDANKAEILRLLKQAREEAMDGGSSEEKTAIFQRYKGKINNYLSKQGLQSEKKSVPARPQTNSLVR